VQVLKEYLIGTGGWAYFQIPGLDPLVAYSRLFNFVEVNSTFYQIPGSKEVEKWRKLVPPDFKFSARAHRSITHDHKLQPTQETLETLEKMKHTCSILNAEILHLQTPPTLKPTQAFADDLRTLLGSVNLGGLRLALEIRATKPPNLPPTLLRTMQDHNIVHSVDLSKGETPAYESDTLYTRLFGKGKHNVYQPTDEELAEIDNKASSAKSEKVVMSFHFVRMYKDAARLKTYKQTGKFPNITRSTGLTSLEEVLREDAKFPTTKQELIRSQGWKLFDLTKTEKAHAEDLLQKLPERTYNDINEITGTLQSVVR
jgi:uncharacterized protein YecE (DUF72 family)